jgi:apoptosis-inducing factor 3
MADEQATPTGPDLTQGVALSDLVDGRLVGHVGDEVLLVQVGSECHYHGPLADVRLSLTTLS